MIYGKHVRLRGTEREDLPHFVNWLNDPEVNEGLSIYLPISMAEESQWFEKMLEREREEHVLAIDAKIEGKWVLIGSCAFDNIEWNNRAAEIGIAIGDKKHWDMGYGTEALQLLLRHGFGTLNLNRIFLRVHENNARAIHTYEKIGFSHEGRMRQAIFKKGSYQDMLFMSILRSEWEASHP